METILIRRPADVARPGPTAAFVLNSAPNYQEAKQIELDTNCRAP